MLDNLDGKQARRTGTSSPLGMMFDHGCDALTTFLLSLTLGTIIGIGIIKEYNSFLN
jgi:ethanolaminephosphotransferase